MSSFVEVLIENSASAAEVESFELLEAKFEEWAPSEGQLEAWLIKAFARLSSIVRQQAAETSAAMFRKFGETIVNVPPILASPASVGSTWVMVDTAGYTITAGTKLNIASSGEAVVGFEVVEDVVIPPGESSTAEGAVVLRAVIPGTGGNGLSADPVPSDSTAATSAAASITLTAVTSGGVEEETEDTYLYRLTVELQLLSLSLIVPDDFAKDARSIAGIARAICLGGYEGETPEKPLDVTVFATDSAGAALSSLKKEELQERQQAKVPSGVEVFVHDPKYTSVDMTAEVVAQPGFEPASVKAAAETRLAEYLSPAKWGLPTGTGDPGTTPGAWLNSTKVYINEVISTLDRVAGVDRVVLAKIRKHESGSLAASDLTLEGVVPLTEVGTLTVTAVS
jgi:hypothetical protein